MLPLKLVMFTLYEFLLITLKNFDRYMIFFQPEADEHQTQVADIGC